MPAGEQAVKVTISSGHGKYVRGAEGYLDEVNQARRVVEHVADCLTSCGIECETFHDNNSWNVSENLDAIVDWHNSIPCDLSVSIHFNAYEVTAKPMGTECLYVTQQALAARMSAAIANATGLPDRGAKYCDDLAFLNGTTAPAILIETVFVDSSADAEAYIANFDKVCQAIADTIAGNDASDDAIPPSPNALFHATGRCSSFGGPDDEGVSEDEGLAFIYDVVDAPHLFLPQQPEGTTGLARRLDPGVMYVACRWDYDVTPKEMLRDQSRKAMVRAVDSGLKCLAYPADWGPHDDTNRITDLSPALMMTLGIETDDKVEVIYPYTGK
jgi:N-acetylmuramoyl-L-alanine amidase